MDRLQRSFVPAAIGLAALITVLASLVDPYNLFLLGQVSLLIVITTALVLLMGGAGLLSLASAAFLGIGAYGAVILVDRFSVPFLLTLPTLAVVGGLIGWMLGLVSLRLSGFHLAIVTLGFLQIFLIFLKQGGEVTGGGFGLVAPLASLPGVGPLSPDFFALLAVFTAVITVVGAASLMKSRVGRQWLALRDKELAARMQGINVNAMKLRAFAFSSAIISVAGGIYAFLLGSTTPASFTVDASIFHIALVVVGGLTGRVVGAVFAPLILFLVPEWFTFFAEYRELFYATLLLATLAFMPNGISGAVPRTLPIPRKFRGSHHPVEVER